MRVSTVSSNPVAAEAAAAGSRPDWECSTGEAATLTPRARGQPPAQNAVVAFASVFAASAASVTNIDLLNHGMARYLSPLEV